MTRIQNSWSLAKASWAVLKSDKQLAWLPVLSWIVTMLTLGVFALLIGGISQFKNGPATWLLVLCLYVALAFVGTYFLAALVAAANAELTAQPRLSVGDAIRETNQRLHRILPWAVFSGVVSLIISQLQRSGIFGRILASFIDVAWNVLTFLTVPIIVLEDLGPIDALKRSASLFKQTWGENLAAQLGFGVIGLAAMLPGVLVAALGVATGVTAIVAVAVVVAVVWLALVMVTMAALSGIYRTALYRYAVDGRVPDAFADTDLEHAFRSKRASGRGGFGGFGGGFVPN